VVRRLAFLIFLVTGVASPVHAQMKGVRFEITAVGDTTVSFAVGTAAWVHRGLTGIAVDPRRRDALVAQFQVVDVKSGIATAVITGQTTRPAMDHIAILDEPRKSALKTLGFWGGLALGVGLGWIIGTRF
jgi:hypothetical protein